MRTRAWALRIVLGLLGFIAIGAVLGALSGSWDTIGRVIGTGAVGAGVGILSIPLMALADRPRFRVGAMAALGYLGLEALLLLAGIWFIDRGGMDFGEHAFLAAGVASVTLLPTIAALFAMPFLPSRVLPRLTILGSAAAILLCAPAIVQPPWSMGWSMTGQAMVVGLSLGAAILLAFGCLARGAHERPHLGFLLSLVPLATFLLVVAMVFELFESARFGPRDDLSALLVLLWPLSVTVAIWHSTRLLDLRGGQRHLRTAFGLAGLGGSLLLGASAYVNSEGAGALGAACFVVAACVLVAIAVFVRINRRAELTTMLVEVRPGSIPCPRCRRTIELRPGHGTCAACGLAFRLELEAPRCRRCRFDVTHTESEVCPECGEPILLPVAAAPGSAPPLPAA